MKKGDASYLFLQNYQRKKSPTLPHIFNEKLDFRKLMADLMIKIDFDESHFYFWESPTFLHQLFNN